MLQHFFRADTRPLLKLPLQVLGTDVDVRGNGGKVGLLAVVVVEKLYRGGDALELDLLGGGHGLGFQAAFAGGFKKTGHECPTCPA